ncbi:MAG TPA: immune inhibitor A domain-containing protein [Solirubrobacteraceae bacterium]|jgi:M6 family metalloprotease-like protein
MRRLPSILLAACLLLAAGLTLFATGTTSSAGAAETAVPATLDADDVKPGEALHVRGRIERAGTDAVKLQVQLPNGELRGPYGPFAVAGDRLSATVPGEATAGLKPGRDTGFTEVVGVQALPASATQTSRAATAEPRAAAADVVAPPAGPVLENQFVSHLGWVKPGESYPFFVRVKNYGAAPVDGGTVTIPPVDGATFTKADGAALDGGAITWNVGEVPGTTDPRSPGVKTLLVEAKAKTLDDDPKVVWKNLAATATGTTTGAPVTSHGPKVIPPSEAYNTARYGDRPFPVVPVEYADRSRAAESQADVLAKKINDPGFEGSTFNLYQEMSYGQLYPHGTVPSSGIATADWNYGPGFEFTHTQTGNTCQSPTTNDLPGNAYQQRGPRIKDGWYQLPGTTGYYGSDGNGSALIGAEAAVGALQQIDSGCGAPGKSVFDSAQIADPETNYDDYDTDKDGVVDFFMVVFPGAGGNGESQTSVPPYDNIWPHSASLEDQFVGPCGQAGYVSDDQRTDIEGRPLWFTDDSCTSTTTENKGDKLKAYTRVGPYNLNPESAIQQASVISHEYGHSLGLPDYYSTGSRGTYGSWNLMATDHSQHMDVNGRQELGWLVPRVLDVGQSRTVNDFVDSTHNTHRIDWQSPDGTNYTLQGDNVANGEAYAAKLPQRQVIQPSKVPSGTHLWWSQAGNDFGCPSTKGHNLDIDLKALRDVAPGTPITLTFKTAFNIEWDYDYGFVLGSTDGGRTYHSYASQKGYSTDQSQNPNAASCQQKFGNGITGAPEAYDNGTAPVDRVQGNYEDIHFVDDSYDLSDLAGKASVLRFTYATDGGLAKAGWFIDDLEVKAGDRVIYKSDFETANDTQIYNGGCREGLQTSPICTHGWQYTSAVDGDPADHAYYLEMRDRAGFDADGHGQDERAGGPSYEPSLSLVYTDENHGYGNVGTDDPPAQTPVDAKPDPGNRNPNLDDAGFNAFSRQRYTDAGQGWIDNYTDPASVDGNWHHAWDCLTFRVTGLVGDGVGPTTAPGDLKGNVNFDMGKGCAKFDYGYGRGSNAVSVPGVTPAGESGSKGGGPTACKATAGQFKRAPRLKRARRGVRFTLAPRSKAQRFRVDVFEVSKPKRVIGQRLVARFRNRKRSFTWNGRGQGDRRLVDGLYVVRVVARTGQRTESRRIALVRSKARFRVRRAFDVRSTCGIIRAFRATLPVLGGRTERPLDVRYRLGAKSRVSIAIVRGKKVVRRLRTTTRSAGRTYKVRLTALKLPKGELKVILNAKSGNVAAKRVLAARKL